MHEIISIQNVSKNFGDKTVIDNLSLSINKGEFIVLLGESGCGKTTTLKMLNKLESISSGSILINGEDISKVDTIALRRSIGYVVQSISLFPHMTILDNMTNVLRLDHKSKEERVAKAKELINVVGLPEEMLHSYPDALSGGQQQRIGFARALANNPDIILMDEPFSALDPITRESLQEEIKALQRKMGQTIIFVTHSIDEALTLADRICILEKGKIAQYATPQEILNHPANGFVLNFIGKNRLWQNPQYIDVASIMSEKVITIPKQSTIIVASTKMRENNVDAAVVLGKKRTYFGILEMDNLIDATLNLNTLVEDVCRTDYEALKTTDTIDLAIEIMIGKKQKMIPVLDDDGDIVGILTRARLFNKIGVQFINPSGLEMEDTENDA